jgi:hypothetical protein
MSHSWPGLFVGEPLVQHVQGVLVQALEPEPLLRLPHRRLELTDAVGERLAFDGVAHLRDVLAAGDLELLGQLVVLGLQVGVQADGDRSDGHLHPPDQVIDAEAHQAATTAPSP